MMMKNMLKRLSLLLALCLLAGLVLRVPSASALKPELTGWDAYGDETEWTPPRGAKLILLAFWEPWNGRSRKSMETVNTLYQRYRDRGLAVLGAYCDETDHDGVPAREIAAENGARYPLLRVSPTLSGMWTPGTVPYTLLLDGEGEVISFTSEELAAAETYAEEEYNAGRTAEFGTDPTLGGPGVRGDLPLSVWDGIISARLGKGGGGGGNRNPAVHDEGNAGGSGGRPSENGNGSGGRTVKKGYAVTVVNGDGNPVEGATVELCYAGRCITRRTNEDGQAFFGEVPAGKHEVTLLRAPEGYKAPAKNPVLTSPYESGVLMILRDAD